MARKKHLINVHTSTGTTAPTGASLYLGEIAVQHTTNDPGLWIKMGTTEASTTYEKFIGKTEITNMVSATSGLVNDLSAVTLTGVTMNNSPVNVTNHVANLGTVITAETQLSTATTGTGNVVCGITVNNHQITTLMFSAAPASSLVALSAATTAHTANTTMHITAAERTRWNNAWTSGVSAYTKVENLTKRVDENEEVVAGALNNLNNRVSVVETHMTGDYIPITGYMLASGTTEEELTLRETDTINEALGKLQKQSLDNEEAIAAGLNDLNQRVTENANAIAKNTGVTALSGAVRYIQNQVNSLGNDYYDFEHDVRYEFSASTVVLSSATQSLSAAVQSISAKTSGILTINANGVEQGRYSPSANTTIDLQIVQDVTGADVLLTGYELATGTTEEELAIVATDTVNEAFGKIQKQNYDNEAVVAGALNDLDERILALEAGGGTEEIWDEIEDQELIVAAALNDLNDRIIDLSGDSSYHGSLIQVLSGLVADISGNTGGGGGGGLTGVTYGGTNATVTNQVAAIPTASSSTFGVVKTGNFITNTNGSIAVSTGTTNTSLARGDQFAAVSAATTSHTANGDIHVTSAQKTAWTNGANSGASAYTKVEQLSASVKTKVYIVNLPSGEYYITSATTLSVTQNMFLEIKSDVHSGLHPIIRVQYDDDGYGQYYDYIHSHDSVGDGLNEIWFYCGAMAEHNGPALLMLHEQNGAAPYVYLYNSRYFDELSAATVAISANVAKIAVTGVTVTGTGNAITNASYANSALTLTKGNVLTAETLTGVSAGGTNVTVTNKVAAIPSASTNSFGVVKIPAQGTSYMTNNAGTIGVAVGTGSTQVAKGSDFAAVSAATTAHTGNSAIHVPAASAANNGKIPVIRNGVWVLEGPVVSVYNGSSAPNPSMGNNGDIYLQTS